MRGMDLFLLRSVWLGDGGVEEWGGSISVRVVAYAG